MAIAILTAYQQRAGANISDLRERRREIDEGYADAAILCPIRRRTMDHPGVMDGRFTRFERCRDRLESGYVEIGDLAAAQHVVVPDVVSDRQLTLFMGAGQKAHGAALGS